MAVKIKQAFLYILDNKHQTLVRTQKAMDDQVDGAYRFLQKSIEKLRKNALGKPGCFKEESSFRSFFMDYRHRTMTFQALAEELATRRYRSKVDYEMEVVSDLFLCEVEISEVEYVVGIEINCKEGMIHHVNQQPDGVQNNLLVHQAIVPNATLKNATFFMIESDAMDLTIIESPIQVVTEESVEEVNLYSDQILECQTKVSIKEGVQASTEVAKEVVEKYGLNPLTVVPALERLVEETVNEGKELDLNEIAEEVFFENPEVKKAYQEELKTLGVDEPIVNQHQVKLPSKKTQRIKTDTGIEVIVPVEHCQNADYIEVVNLPNGQLSLQLKNIGTLKNV